MTLIKEHFKPQKRQPAGWRSIVLPIAKPLIVTLATSIASVLAYVMTPAGDFVRSKIWSEKANILLIAQNSDNLHMGQVLSVDVIVQSMSPTPLSPGILEIKYSPGTLRPGAETTSIITTQTPKISGSEKVNHRTLEFIADNVGPAEVSAILHTGNGRQFSKKLSFDVHPADAQLFPTRLSFTGNWNIDLGGIPGNMQLRDVARSLNGDYKLSDGNYGQVEGTHDGKTFRVSFYRGSSPSRYFLEGTFDPDPTKDLEITGRAKLLVPTGDSNNPWKVIREVDFHAVAASR
ncbi:Uncharacterised protein [Burkholderia pseudomallei]|uniref:hypothetical protein n=1 Tax=Burkholderia pseudomallei TaxID=28450 RepID=UPI000F1B7068|nr:hypothetical protein [Burkholderia pseudomallei]VCC54075.1 Uncharacterised protein [Burkholderia pseudomallei]VCD11814.1 Uncharacterised protein [Burkholderia pseudomallei]